VKKQVVVLSCLTFILVFLAPFPGSTGFRLISSPNYDDLQLSESISTGYHTRSIPVSWTGHGLPPETGSIVQLLAMEALSGYAAEEKHYGSSITSPRSDRQLFVDSALQYSSHGNQGTSRLTQYDNTLTMSCREPIEPFRLAQNRQAYSPRLLPSGTFPSCSESPGIFTKASSLRWKVSTRRRALEKTCSDEQPRFARTRDQQLSRLPGTDPFVLAAHRRSDSINIQISHPIQAVYPKDRTRTVPDTLFGSIPDLHRSHTTQK